MLQEITRERVQLLANKTELIGLFGDLGYKIDPAYDLLPATVIIPPDVEGLIQFRGQIASIAEDWTIRIYLFELRPEVPSITETLKRKITSAFRDLDGDFLLVFTIDY